MSKEGEVKKNFFCDQCPSGFAEKKNLNKHIKNLHKPKKILCSECDYKTNSNYAMKIHFQKHSKNEVPPKIVCDCGYGTRDKSNFHKHVRKCQKRINRGKSASESKQSKKKDSHCDESEQCLGGVLETRTFYNRGSKDILYVMERMKDKVKAHIYSFFKKMTSLKFQIVLHVKFKKLNEEHVEGEAFFCGRNRRILDISEFRKLYQESKEKIWHSFDQWLKEGSGWVIKSIEKLTLEMCEYRPYQGSSYIKSPSWVLATRSVLNIENFSDNMCFLWHIAAAIYPTPVNAERPSKYENYLSQFDVTGIQWPMDIKRIHRFEKQNQLSINVYKADMKKKAVWPIRISKRRDSNPINLLLLSDNGMSHYTLIKNFDKLLSRGTHPKTYCFYCLHGFDKRCTSQKQLQEHMKVCYTYGGQITKLPEVGENFIEFTNYHKMLKCPFTIYADFECIQTKIGIDDSENQKAKTRNLTKHEVSGYAYCIVSPYFKTKYKIYRGPDASERFLKQMMFEKKEISKKVIENEKEMKPLTLVQEREFVDCRICHICKEMILEQESDCLKHLPIIKPWLESVRLSTDKPPSMSTIKKQRIKILLELHPDKNKGREEECKKVISDLQELLKYYQSHSELLLIGSKNVEEMDLSDEELEKIRKKGFKVRDHDHWTGEFRGAAHSGCNILYRKVKKIPVFFHNMGGYDGHLIFQDISKLDLKSSPQLIAKSLENYTAIKFGSLEIKDSLNFLSSSLDKLVKNLKVKAEGSLNQCFPNTYRYFKENCKGVQDKGFEMLTRKLVFPYDYMDDWSKMEETRLPPKEKFYSSLSGKHITDEEYSFAQTIWSTFKLKNLGELHDLYMATDVALLADVFESFRNSTLENYGLDPAHFYTAPGLSWEAALKQTKIRLELITDIDMYMFIDQGMMGGVSMIGKQYSRANHPKLNEQWDPKKKQKYIFMVDCTNQYGWSMMQYLPVDGFKWVDHQLSTQEWVEFINNQNDEQEKGYFFEVDLNYPEQLHILHDQYPLAPEHLTIKKEMLSQYQRQLGENLGVKFEGKKLCPTLYDKKQYICHYRCLKQYLELGLVLTKVHRVIEFNQRPWLKSYIEHNTELRRKATCKFDENQAKLMNNSFFGKTCEDTRKYKDVRIVLNKEELSKLTKKEGFSQFKIYGENIATVMMNKPTVKLNKPRYIGMTVLNLAKLKMNDFHYNYIMKTFPNTKLLFTDTDSFCYEISSELDIYEVIKGCNWFDFSNYPKDHPLYDNGKKLKPGYFKDEFGGQIILEMVGLRPKMYSLLLLIGLKKAAAKGINENVKEEIMTHQDYKQSLFEKFQRLDKMRRIQNKDHQLYTVEIEKRSLNPFDDKKYRTSVDEDYLSFSFGHYMIDAMQMDDELWVV